MAQNKRIVGIDNGISGTVAIMNIDGSVEFYQTPKTMQQDYTKAKKNVSRVDAKEMYRILQSDQPTHVCLERPMVNPTMFQSTLSAVRALEATLIILEILGFSYEFIDSRQWQKVLLPSGCVGKENLKKASMDIGVRLFPEHKELIEKHKDADGLLIAEWVRRNRL